MPTTRDLLYSLPKLLAVVERPFDWVLFLLAVSLFFAWRRRERAARRTLAAAVLLLFFLGFVNIPELIIQRLENAYPPTTRPITEFEGVLVLGGSLDSALKSAERNQTLLNSGAERLTTAVAFARRYPHLKIVLAGHAGEREPSNLPAAFGMRKFFEEQDAPTAQLLLEPEARNTAEIAENVKAIQQVDPTKPWLLLTSAINMPRALLSFRRSGWNVEPYPVDYFTGTTIRLRYSVMGGAGTWSAALHEVLGLLWYRVTGR